MRVRWVQGPGTATLVSLLVLAGLVMADDKQTPKGGRSPGAAAQGSPKEKTSGVILKVEPAAAVEGAGKRAWKLTVNTDVVWRDFVRDQAAEPRKAARTGTDRAARKGQESVATEGHPTDQELLVPVDLDARTEITMRFRSSTDSIGEGAATAEGAAKAEAIASTPPGGKTPEAGAGRQGPRARVLDPGELKPGLWVDIEFRKADQRNQAARIVVLRPVGGPDTPPDKKPATTTPGR